MPKELKYWETEDGRQFIDYSEAAGHERRIKLKQFFDRSQPPVVGLSVDTIYDVMATFVADNLDEINEIMGRSDGR
jgi:hypothetical protein